MSEKVTLFDRFGGTRKMADALGEAPSTVQSWKSAGRIPAGHQPNVLATAQSLGLEISAEDVIFPLGAPDELLLTDEDRLPQDGTIDQEADSRADPFSASASRSLASPARTADRCSAGESEAA